MLRKALPYLVLFALLVSGLSWWIRGTVNPPVMAASGAQLEKLLRERIKLPAGYTFDIFAGDFGDVRLMQMTESGDLVVSGYRSGVIYLFKPDGSHKILMSDLDLPHGLLLEGSALYVAEQSRVVKYDFDGKALSNAQVLVSGLPDDGGHSSRTLKRGPDGYLYVTVGSSCNSCIEEHPWRAAMLRFREGGKPEIFASGLRNTVGFDWQP